MVSKIGQKSHIFDIIVSKMGLVNISENNELHIIILKLA